MPEYRVTVDPQGRELYERIGGASPALNVGLGYYAKSGKDTLCALIMQRNRHYRRALADSVKEELGCMLLNLDVRIEGNRQRAFDFVDGRKDHPAMRRMMQAYGDGKRETVSKTYWIGQVEGYVAQPRPPRLVYPSGDADPPQGVIVPDLRYRNEAAHWIDRHFLCVAILRPDAPKLPGDLSQHISEQDLMPQDFPFMIVNDQRPEDMLPLYDVIERWFRHAGNPPHNLWPYTFSLRSGLIHATNGTGTLLPEALTQRFY